MDIFDNSERQVFCISNADNDVFDCDENSPLLTVGEKYTVIDVEVHSWHSLVTLKEFPDRQFNSVLFEEIE